MKFTITICLFFTHYVCGGPCFVEKDASINIATIETPGKFYKHKTQLTIAERLQIAQPAKRIIYNKRFAKRYRKIPRLLTACLQNHETNTGFCTNNSWQNIQSINRLFNPWLPAYLSLFAFFRM